MLFEAHGEVKGANVFGQRADGDVVHTGFGEFTDRVERDVPGNFKLGAAVSQFYRLAHLLSFEIVEHDDIGSGLNGLLQLFQAFDFHFNRDVRVQPEGFLNGLAHGTRRNNVVLFDQEGIG